VPQLDNPAAYIKSW
jgi:hypothetical protein